MLLQSHKGVKLMKTSMQHPAIIIPRLVRPAIFVVIFITFSLGTSPLPPPYHQYSVSGVLGRPAGGSKKGFAVLLLGRFKDVSMPDSSFQILRGIPYPRYRDVPISITDSAGSFSIRASSDIRADSLRLAVIVPDRPLTTGTPYYVDASLAVPNTETYKLEPEPGCSSCATDPGTQTRIVFYSYYFDNKVITISF